MNKLAFLLLTTVLLTSCNETIKEKNEVQEDTAEITTSDTTTEAPYKFSLAQWALHVPIHAGEMDPMDFAEYAKKHNFDGLEYVNQLFTLDSTVTHREAVMNMAKAWKAKGEEFDIPTVLIMIDHEGELADPSAEKRKIALENHKLWVDAAAYLEAPSIRVNLFGLTEPKAWHEASVTSLKELSSYAATKNIHVLVENHAQLSNDAAKLVEVIKEVNMPNCGTLPDFGNFCIEREGGERWGPAPCIKEYDAYKGMEELMPYAGGVSAKSYAFDEAGNETKIDYYRMMQIVKDANFSGYVGVEFEGGTAADPTADILATRALLEKAIKAAK